MRIWTYELACPESPVRIEVLDAMGRRIKTLLMERSRLVRTPTTGMDATSVGLAWAQRCNSIG